MSATTRTPRTAPVPEAIQGHSMSKQRPDRVTTCVRIYIFVSIIGAKLCLVFAAWEMGQ